jgi:hypothetical protein
MIARLILVAAVAFFSFKPAIAANDREGKACLLHCQTDLKSRGLWTSYPRGYCRKQCDYWVGAPPDFHRQNGVD